MKQTNILRTLAAALALAVAVMTSPLFAQTRSRAAAATERGCPGCTVCRRPGCGL